jgi:cytochrome c oxidase subunit 1
MFAQGMAGMLRRMYDGAATYSAVSNPGATGALSASIIHTNVTISIAAWCLALSQIPFILNFFWSINNGRPVVTDNPWDATTLDWQTPTPPPHGNFLETPTVVRGPYEYSVPGHKKDFLPQNEPA